MKDYIFCLLILYSSITFSQELNPSKTTNPILITPEILAGITGDSNSDFPDHKLQKQLILSLSWDHTNNLQDWARVLNGPRTGISIGYTDFGNSENLGSAISALTFIEFHPLNIDDLTMHIGTGASYFNKKFDPVTNPNNQAVSTKFTWSFRAFSYYTFLKTKKMDWRAGIGVFHHSNGHSSLPNQGYNSFLLSLSTDIKTGLNKETIKDLTDKPYIEKDKASYLSFRVGYGTNVLSKAFNDNKDVYTFSGEYGKIYKNTFKLGIGFYYRFYQSYYDYIVDNESLVQDGREFENYKDNPTKYASNIGLTINGEIFLNHFGIDLQIGFNLYKPSYDIDWRLNQGWSYVPKEIPENSAIVLGEYNSYYKLKKLISTRLGLKYYLVATNKQPKSNLYLGVFINGNLGQADFTEIAIGYVHQLKRKK